MDWTLIITTFFAASSPLIAVYITLNGQHKLNDKRTRDVLKNDLSKDYYVKRITFYSEILYLCAQIDDELIEILTELDSIEISETFEAVHETSETLYFKSNDKLNLWMGELKNTLKFNNLFLDPRVQKDLSNVNSKLFWVSHHFSNIVFVAENLDDYFSAYHSFNDVHSEYKNDSLNTLSESIRYEIENNFLIK